MDSSFKKKLHRFVVYWRRYATFPLLITQMITSAYCSNIVYACVIALWLTVPCGIKVVNRKWYLWYPRQLLFATMSVLALQ
jgi:hypothetical protein